MKFVAVVVTGAILLVSSVATAKEVTEKLTISGWHCDGCAAKTAAKVRALNGVKDAEADRDSKTLTVTYDDSKVTEADITKLVSDLRYKVVK